ncbi:MAG: type II secretion system major pseudopilin GspG [Kiritimatiellae bacterium]|nr:type II secretion system major pseudopilin GspG [Kiritimatiellia bacterium]
MKTKSRKRRASVPLPPSHPIIQPVPRRAASSNHSSSGFTLIEILVVLIIITILAGVVSVSVLRKPGEARVAAARMQIKQLQTAVRLYHAEQNGFPTQNQGLEALVRKPSTDPVPKEYPAEGYLDSSEIPLDPWGNPYVYLVPGRKNEPFEVICYGSDGEPGGEGEAADLSSSTF